MIRVENVTFEYPGKRALDNVSFHIKSGSVTALVGPNGAGKTTLMRSIAALDDPFSGSIHVDGINVEEAPRKVHRIIGYLSDFFGLYEDLTVRQCLDYIARTHMIPEKEIVPKIEMAIYRLSLSEYVDTKAASLSRGWRQRLGIAQAIIHEPKLLLLDEPASGLDPEARHSLSKLFLSLKDQGMTLLVSSHILAELEDYCTDMLLLREGRVVHHLPSEKGKTESSQKQLSITFTRPGQEFLLQLSEITILSDVTAKNNMVRCTFTGTEDEQHKLLKTLIEKDLPVTGFITQEKTLQDIYMDVALKGETENAN